VRKELKSVRCSELRKRLREPKSVVSAGRLFHDFTTWQAKKIRLTLTGAWVTGLLANKPTRWQTLYLSDGDQTKPVTLKLGNDKTSNDKTGNFRTGTSWRDTFAMTCYKTRTRCTIFRGCVEGSFVQKSPWVGASNGTRSKQRQVKIAK